MLLLQLLTACTSVENKEVKKDPEELDENVTSTTDQTENFVGGKTEDFKSFDILSMLPTGESEFDKIVAENEIDADYKKEKTSLTGNKEFTDLELKYIDIWEKEIDRYYKELLTKISEESAQKLTSSQNVWEEFIDLYKNADYSVICESDEALSPTFKWQLLSHLREEYRERAFHLMYLNYCIN